MGPVLGIIYRTIASYLISAGGYHRATAQAGALTLVQRFGNAVNMNVHIHMQFPDGVYVTSDERFSFWRVPLPTVAVLEKLVHGISRRAGRALER
jgi:Putative transposase